MEARPLFSTSSPRAFVRRLIWLLTIIQVNVINVSHFMNTTDQKSFFLYAYYIAGLYKSQIYFISQKRKTVFQCFRDN